MSPSFSFGSPPPALLRVIADWLTENPSLLRTPLTLPSNAPPQRKQALLTAPLLGLLRWSIKAPLIEVACKKLLQKLSNEEVAPSSSSSSTSKNAAMKASATTQLTLTAVYSQLHLAVLNCFMTQMEESENLIGGAARIGGSSSSSAARPAMEPFSANQILSLAQDLVSLEADTKAVNAAAPLRSQSPDTIALKMETETTPETPMVEESRAMDTCVNRLAQVIQVAKATGALISQPGELKRIEAFLTKNPLISIVVANWDPSAGR